jgi:hypothetical protein
MGRPDPLPVVAAPRPTRKPAPAVVAPAPPAPPPPYTVEAIRGAKRTQEPVKNEGEERPKDVPPSEENPK